MYLTITLLVISLLLLHYLHRFLTRNFGIWKELNVAYIRPIPLFGNLLDVALFRVSIGQHLGNLYTKTKEPLLGIFLFDKPGVVLRDPELIKTVLVKDFKYFDDRTVSSTKHDPMVGHMLLFSKNPEWRIMRNGMTPVFTSGKLKAMVPFMHQCCKVMVEYLKGKSDGSCVEAKEVCNRYSTNVLVRCAFGIDALCFEKDDSEFRKVGKMVFDFSWSNAIQQTAYFFLPELVDIFKLKFVNPKASSFLREIFWNSVAQRESSGIKRNDVIDALVKMKNDPAFRKEVSNFEGDKVVAQAGQFFFAGFETTSSTIAFTLYELCIHPEIQRRLREEILTSLQENGSFTYDGVQEMKYLHMCLSEALRKYPSLPFLDRKCRTDYHFPNTNIFIPKGSPVYIPMMGLHYDEEYFPQPHEFDPERFSLENLSNIKPFTYLPFGGGLRNCIGDRFGMLSAKLGLCYLLSEFEIVQAEDTPVPIVCEPRSFTFASKVGLPMRFKKIHAA